MAKICILSLTYRLRKEDTGGKETGRYAEDGHWGLSSFAANVKKAKDATVKTVSQTAKQIADETNEKIKENQSKASAPQIEQKTKFCSECGSPLAAGAKFCSNCGSTVGIAGKVVPPPIPKSETESRKQEFVGKVYKCPHCGGVITQTTVICPECGNEITGQSAVSSVQAFSQQLMDLEYQRKGPGFAQLMGMLANPVDQKKLTLIQSFPIPNTIADIQEFMLLAASNIDVALSKNTFSNNSARKMQGSMNANMTMPRSISDAWVSKMQQAYQKAAVMFPNESVFENIKRIYLDKMKELKMKITE